MAAQAALLLLGSGLGMVAAAAVTHARAGQSLVQGGEGARRRRSMGLESREERSLRLAMG